MPPVPRPPPPPDREFLGALSLELLVLGVAGDTIDGEGGDGGNGEGGDVCIAGGGGDNGGELEDGGDAG